MSIEQSNEEYARAIYEDIYSIYEQTSNYDCPVNKLLFERDVTRKYTLSQIMLVCDLYSITHKCRNANAMYYTCMCLSVKRDIKLSDTWINTRRTMYIKLMDIFVAFTPSTEYILK
jgi:hypothetical protein